MSVNHTAWNFIAEAERVVAAYLEGLVSADVVVVPAITTDTIQTPHIAVRNTSVRPFTDAAAIVAHVEAVTTITIRTAYDEHTVDAGRENHNALVASVMGCLMVVDETTGENALPGELNAVSGGAVQFSMARWAGSMSGIDDDARHFITRINVDTIIGPQPPEA